MSIAPARSAGKRAALGGVLAIWLIGQSVRAEDRADFKYQLWLEDNNRIKVESSYWLVEKEVAPGTVVKAQGAFDAVTGSTPTGAPPPPDSRQVPTVEIEDHRAGGTVELRKTWEWYTLGLQVAGSTENDYESISVGLNQTVDLWKRNTTVLFGAAATFDEIEAVTMENGRGKDTFDFILGLTQVLTPSTVLQANFTYGFGTGFFSDPYRIAEVDRLFFFENRPDYKDRRVAYVKLAQSLDRIHASFETDYRYYEDSFGITSHTYSFTWHQFIGDHVVISPFFRYHRQGQAEFYDVRFTGAPRYFSADWRLSEMETMSFGGEVALFINETLSFDVTFERYEMNGLDNKTQSTAYAPANILTVGASYRF